jgi:hypothetical protein
MAVETTMSDITTLISCIIFICLQNLQDSQAAYQLLKSGHSLIGDIDRRILCGELVLAASETTVLNSFLRPIIERLRMRFCCIVDVPSALALSAAIKKTKTENRVPFPQIDSPFVSLLEARNKLEVIVEWAQENIETSIATSNDSSQVQFLLASWLVALDAIDMNTLGRYDTLVSSQKLLRAAAIMASILFDTLGTHSECSYDEYTDKFAEIVKLYEFVIGHRTSTGMTMSFGIDAGVIDTLTFVAGRCRDPVIRRSALRLLAESHRLEGDLQGSTGATIIATLMDFEEEGLCVTEASDVPEAQRLRIWEDHQYWDTGEIQIFFVTWPYEPSLGAEVKQATVQLPLPALRDAKEKAAPGSPGTRLPNVKYGRGVGAFLEEGSQTYHQITLSSFFMPIPRL